MRTANENEVLAAKLCATFTSLIPAVLQAAPSSAASASASVSRDGLTQLLPNDPVWLRPAVLIPHQDYLVFVITAQQRPEAWNMYGQLRAVRQHAKYHAAREHILEDHDRSFERCATCRKTCSPEYRVWAVYVFLARAYIAVASALRGREDEYLDKYLREGLYAAADVMSYGKAAVRADLIRSWVDAGILVAGDMS